jgi:hypothetical protein
MIPKGISSTLIGARSEQEHAQENQLTDFFSNFQR